MRRIGNVLRCLTVIATLPACTPPTGSHGGATADGGADSGLYDPNAPALSFQVTSASATGSILGTVQDFTTGAPVIGATVTAGSATDTTASDGTFVLSLPTGRARLAITAPGYVPSTAVVGVASDPLPFVASLHPADAAQSVDATGAMITTNGATLNVPAGAFPTATMVSATWLTGREIITSTRSRRFNDADGTQYRIAGVLAVDVATEPTMPVIVTVPIPAGVDASLVKLFPRFADGTHDVGIAPSSVADAIATFAVPHFSEEDVAAPATQADPSYDVVQASPGVTATSDPPPEGSSDPNAVSNGPVASGDDLAGDSADVSVPAHGAVQLVHEATDAAVWYWNTGKALARIGVRAIENAMVTTPAEDDTGSGGSLAHKLASGLYRWVYPIAGPGNAISDATNTIFDSWNLQIQHQDTIITLNVDECASGDREIASVETSEGSATVISGGVETSVVAGKTAQTCIGCANPTDPPVCVAPACTCAGFGGPTPISGACSPDCGPNPLTLTNGTGACGYFVQNDGSGFSCTYYACSCIGGSWQCIETASEGCP